MPKGNRVYRNSPRSVFPSKTALTYRPVSFVDMPDADPISRTTCLLLASQEGLQLLEWDICLVWRLNLQFSRNPHNS